MELIFTTEQIMELYQELHGCYIGIAILASAFVMTFLVLSFTLWFFTKDEK